MVRKYSGMSHLGYAYPSAGVLPTACDGLTVGALVAIPVSVDVAGALVEPVVAVVPEAVEDP